MNVLEGKWVNVFYELEKDAAMASKKTQERFPCLKSTIFNCSFIFFKVESNADNTDYQPQ